MAKKTTAKLKVYLESTISGYATDVVSKDPLTATYSQIALAGYKCPQIMTPQEFMEDYV